MARPSTDGCFRTEGPGPAEMDGVGQTAAKQGRTTMISRDQVLAGVPQGSLLPGAIGGGRTRDSRRTGLPASVCPMRRERPGG